MVDKYSKLVSLILPFASIINKIHPIIIDRIVVSNAFTLALGLSISFSFFICAEPFF